MGNRAREIERKYESSGKAAVPDLAGLPGVAGMRELEPAELDAVYFDTADLRLAVRRITLRRRTGGDDAGWHLKLPADGADTRTEVHVPLGDADEETVPEELAAEVAAYTRGEKLIPVVRLRNTRRRLHLLSEDGTPLAEIARDSVTAEQLGVKGGPEASTTWFETEVELLDGPLDLLDAVEERLIAAGLHRSESPSKLARALGPQLATAKPPPQPPAGLETAGDVALAYIHQQVQAILAYDPQVRRDEEDAVHQMRVSTRRLRSALKSFRRQLDRAATDPVGDELRWLAGVLGMERDREVLAERVAARLAELPPGLATEDVRRRLLDTSAVVRPEAREELLRELNGTRYFSLLDRIEALLADPPFLDAARAPARKAVAKVVRRDHRRLRRRIAAALAIAPGKERDVALHDARKAAKRARYSSEAVQPVLGKPAKKHTQRMRSIAQLLSEHQDSVMCREAIVGVAVLAAAAGESLRPYEALLKAERKLAAEVEARLPKAWRKADRGKLAG
jgi:CHAD domain-containing protein